MAISYSTAIDGYKALQLVGVSVSMIEALKKAKVTIPLTSKHFRFVGPDGVQLGHVDVTPDILQKIGAGVLPTTLKLELAGKLSKAAENVMGYLGSTATAPHDETPGQDESAFKGTLAKLPKLNDAAKEQAPAKPGGSSVWEVLDPSKMKTYPMVPLRDATHLYQPVNGTSGGSRYFVVAGGEGVMVAARYKNGSLSVRVEGQKFPMFKKAIGEGGLKVNGDYASVHLEVADDHIAQKALGAVLLGLGIPLTSPIPNLMLLKGV